jgi:hypothetical protein
VPSFFRIGGLTIAIDPAIALPEPLSRFSVEETGEVDLRIDVGVLERYEPPRGPLLFDSGEVWRLYADDDARGDAVRIECRSEAFGDEPYKIARVNRDLRRAEILIREPDLLPVEFPLDELLVNALLSHREGIELHACGIIDTDGSGYLFAGNSGDGKTTTARLWVAAGADIVSDDRIIVRRYADGWRMFGTPWHGEAEICSPSSAPLRRVFLLDKAKPNAAELLDTGEAVARLLSCAFPPFHDPDALQRMLETMGRLVAEVPVARLRFLNDASAVEFVRECSISPR